MIRQTSAAMALLFLASCASTADAPSAAPAPPPPDYAAPSSPAPSSNVAAPEVAAPGVTAPPAPRAPPPAPPGDVVVPGQVQRQIPPTGDSRTVSERMADIRAWDQCVMSVQNAGESDPMRPQLDTPEDVCQRQLGMADRTAVPISRQR